VVAAFPRGRPSRIAPIAAALRCGAGQGRACEWSEATCLDACRAVPVPSMIASGAMRDPPADWSTRSRSAGAGRFGTTAQQGVDR
jgi:hypothetical protein